MKKTFLALAALLLAAVAVQGGNTVKKSYAIDGFSGIRASDAFQVVVKHSDTFFVEVEVSEEFLPYVSVKNDAGILELGFSKVPVKVQQKKRSRVAKAVVHMPELHLVSLSGASRLSSDDSFVSPMHAFAADLSGASEIGPLSVQAPDVDIALSGASKAVVSLRASEVKAGLSGASRLDVVGRTADFTVKAAGASKVNAEAFEARAVDVDASGASKVDVLPVEELRVDLSGASKCEYYGDGEALRIKSDNIAGASTLKRHK